MARPIPPVPFLAGLLGAVAGAAATVAGCGGAGMLVAAFATAGAVLIGARAATARIVPAAGSAPVDVAPVDPAIDLIDGIADPVLLVADGTVAQANLAARALLGAHILGEDARVALRHPGAAERIALGDGDPAPIMLAGPGGRDRRWEMRVARTGAGRRLVHLVDRSAAHAAERTRVDFVANVSHELRTPLASLLGYVETLLDPRGTEPATRHRFLGIMEGEARRMQRLIDDLISLSRIEAEQHRPPAGTVDLAALVRQVCRERRDSQDGRGADLVAELPGGPAGVTGDAAQLSQLLHNLVGNAMKYGRAGTPVTIALASAGSMWRLTVADRGEGVAPEHLPRLTERFFRVDAGRSRSLGGTGLGLAIVKHVVERHRGRLEITSVVGEGTVVATMLPAANEAPSHEAPSREAPSNEAQSLEAQSLEALSQKGNADAAGAGPGAYRDEDGKDGMMRV